MKVRSSLGAGLASAAVLLAISTTACAPAGNSGQAPPPPTVGVVEVSPQPHERTVRLSGRVSAFQVSEVRPQIGGIIKSRRFTEGAEVRAGQVLYEIDPGPARADLSGAQAAAASAQARYERFQRLIEIGAISQQDLDDAHAQADQTAAALANAQISAGYTRVVAPISGIIGASTVTPGALATPAQSDPFAVIQQIDQVYVDMTMSSAELLRLRQSTQGGVSEQAKVRVTLAGGAPYPIEGQLQFSDVTVNVQTGAVQLRALFPNPDHLLLPGMFVDAVLVVGVDPDAIMVPQAAVTRNASGAGVVLVLNKDNMVEQREIETGGTAGDQWVVLSGLTQGDRVIVDGAMRVQPGAPATPAPAEAAEAQALPQSTAEAAPKVSAPPAAAPQSAQAPAAAAHAPETETEEARDLRGREG